MAEEGNVLQDVKRGEIVESEMSGGICPGGICPGGMTGSRRQ